MNAEPVCCPKCNNRTRKRGFQTYATFPHQRQRYQCKECGYIFVPETTDESDVVGQD